VPSNAQSHGARQALGASLLAAASLAGCAHSPHAAGGPLALDGFLAFSDPKRCDLTGAHERFFRALWTGNPENEDVRPGTVVAPKNVRRAFGPVTVRSEGDYRLVEVAVAGTMLDLPLARIIHALPVGGDPGDVIYTFAAPIGKVEEALRAAGFPAKANETVHLESDGAYDHVMYLIPDPKRAGHTIFGCALQ
jgi:hypothetical protein